MTFIYECPACGQPWEVPTLPRAGVRLEELPDHPKLDPKTSERTASTCNGSRRPGNGPLDRGDWERGWASRKFPQPLPTVLDGSAIRVVG